jgi:NADH-quinone oxidoreductase subunit I
VAYKIPEQKPVTLRERLYLPELVKGLAVTTRHFLVNLFGDRDKNPEILEREGANLVSTVSYPEEKRPYPIGYRGLHRLVPREDGKPRCVACYMCATACPAQCIYIEAGEYPTEGVDAESATIEKYPTKFIIDELRCVVCGLCVEACPKDAIRMDRGIHVPPAYKRPGFLWGIDRLLWPAQVQKHGTDPWKDHPSDPWNKRESSEAPDHVHKEAHIRIERPPAVPITRFDKAKKE